jgi:hypothetical protein
MKNSAAMATAFGRVAGLTGSGETAGGLSRRYEGAEALALREALQALCVHATAEEMWVR